MNTSTGSSAGHVSDPLRMFRVDGMVAVITGGAGGIGLASARLLAAAGAKIVLADRQAPTASGIEDCTACALDVTDANAVDATFKDIAQRFGRIDILLNNAGVSIRKSSMELELEDWNTTMAVNLTGAFLCARAAARHMPDSGGNIVNTASIMGLSGGGLYPNPAYHATKGGLVNLTRALAVEWASRNIRVNAVAPTWTRTSFIGELSEATRERINAVTPLGRLAEPEDVANAVLYLASPAAGMVTGHVLAVDGGFLAQ
ncbi:SDR family NAD(P)-dependent oxidoreductase [Ottowia thiooxydans]|uniref:SDR family NAD(P)-dependent oxidoreductase n=1 Tax=Ottowia thiooxydans TaxID=219182 RepID=UPI0004163853|nr:SDR family oxidoreductase [Ottowia thiooxydans]